MSTATDHRFDTAYLESQVEELAVEAQVQEDNWEEFRRRLAVLHDHNVATYQHCLRVGIFAYRVAKHERWPSPKYALFGGCGHDIGKADIPNRILDAPSSLSQAEFNTIKGHVQFGFERLKDRFLFTALIAGLHHHWQSDGYSVALGKVEPFLRQPGVRERVEQTSKMITLIDFYDAMNTRRDDRGLVDDRGDQTALRRVLEEYFPNSHDRIAYLFTIKL